MLGKAIYLNSLHVTAGIYEEYASEEKKNGDVFSYLTSFGVVQGRKMKLKSLDDSSLEATINSMKDAMKNGEDLDMFSVTTSLFRAQMKEKENSNLEKQQEITNAVHLEDVHIKNNNGDTYNLSHLVLFIDQIIATVPSKLL